jgi:hypothetical protein
MKKIISCLILNILSITNIIASTNGDSQIQLAQSNCNNIEKLKKNFYCHECAKYLNDDTKYRACLEEWLFQPKISEKILIELKGSANLGNSQQMISNEVGKQNLVKCWLGNECRLSRVKAKNKFEEYKTRDKQYCQDNSDKCK